MITRNRVRKKEEWNFLNKSVELGDEVKVISGPMKNCHGLVEAISGNNVTISVHLFGRQIRATFISDDLEIMNK